MLHNNWVNKQQLPVQEVELQFGIQYLEFDFRFPIQEMQKSDNDLHMAINNNSIIIQQPDPHVGNEKYQPSHPLTPLEVLLDKVNGQGAYQFRMFMIFNLMWFVTGWLLLGESFFYDDSFTCKSTSDPTKCQQLVCSMTNEQDRIFQIQTHANSIVFAFEPTYLICELSGVKTVLTSMIFVGSLLGFFVVPYFADNWGRRVAIRTAWIICTMGVAFAAFSSSPSMVGIGYFLAGFGANPAITLCYSFINQQCLGHSRQRYGVLIQVFYAIGQSTIGLLFIQQFSLSWRTILFICLFLSITVDILLIYLIQTPKFLIKKSQRKTMIAFNSIAKRNKRQLLRLEEIQALKIEQERDIDDSSSEEDNYSHQNYSTFSNDEVNDQVKLAVQNRLKHRQQIQSASLILLFKYKSLIWKSLGAGAGFLGIQVIYYSTSFNLDQTGYGKLINQQIIGISEIFGYIGGQFLVSRIQRRKASLIGMTISGVMCLMLALMNLWKNSDNEEVIKVLGIIGLIINRFVLCCFCSIFYVYIAELFPTKVRSLAFGWASAVGTTGSTLAPYIIYFSKSYHIDSWILPGVIGLLSSTLLLKLPQTFGKPSQDWIQEEQQQRLQKQQHTIHNHSHYHHHHKRSTEVTHQ